MAKGLKIGDTFVDSGLKYKVISIHELGYYVSELVGKADSEAKAEKIEKVTTETNLEDMDYNSLKKLAKDKGISAKGNRDEIIERLRGV